MWRDGGYSDDLLTAGYCAEHGLGIAVPATAIFPQQLQQQYSFRQYWNYLRRQLFVLDTYQVGGGNGGERVSRCMQFGWGWQGFGWGGGGRGFDGEQGLDGGGGRGGQQGAREVGGVGIRGWVHPGEL